MQRPFVRSFPLLLVLAGCAAEGTTPSNGTTRIAVTNTPTEIAPGDSLQLEARLVDAEGRVLPATFSYSSNNPAAVTVSASGLLRAVAEAGQATISVGVGALRTAFVVRVERPAVLVSTPTSIFAEITEGTTTPIVAEATIRELNNLPVTELAVSGIDYENGTGWIAPGAFTSPQVPTQLGIAIRPGGLPVSNYRGAVQITGRTTTGAQVRHAVRIWVVVRPAGRVVLSTDTVRVAVSAGAPEKERQVEATPGGSVPYQTLVAEPPIYEQGSGWIRGVSIAPSDQGSTVRIAVDGAGLAVGRYLARLPVREQLASLGIVPDTLVVRLDVEPPAGAVVAMTAGDGHTCALTESGQAYCWGEFLQYLYRTLPAPIGLRPRLLDGGLRFTSLFSGVAHSCGRVVGGTVACWGMNGTGELGTGRASSVRFEPEFALNVATLIGGAAGLHTCFLSTVGELWCAGLNDVGQLGRPTPSGTVDLLPVIPPPTGGFGPVVEVRAGTLHTCARSTGGAVHCWGLSRAIGLPTEPTGMPVPQLVAGAANAVALAAGGSHTCGLRSSGEAFCWGIGSLGELGDGEQISRSTPVQVAGGLVFAELAAGTQFTCGRTTDGKVYCWGAIIGQNGVLLFGPHPNPTEVSAGLTFAGITAGRGHVCGWTTTNAVYCWGRNGTGQLGDGTTADRLVPTRVMLP